MSVDKAFRLLDLLQGHPGYQTKCFVCGGPITDLLGTVLHNNDQSIGIVSDSDGTRHDHQIIGWCPYAFRSHLDDQSR